MEQKTMTKVTAQEIKELFSIMSCSTDKCYITLKDGAIRITFCEVIPGQDDIKAVVSVTLSHSAMNDLYAGIGNVITMLKPVKAEFKDVVDNTEDKKHDTPVLQ
jgi:hypothetical protein